MKEFLINLLNFFGLAFWVEVMTENPNCIYYFGPFLTAAEAHASEEGYLEDIESEGANCFKVSVKRCKPSQLTVVEGLETGSNQQIVPNLSPRSYSIIVANHRSISIRT